MSRRVAVMLSLVAVAVACGTTPSSQSGQVGVSSAGSGTTASTVENNPGADRDRAQNALVTATDLGPGWSTKGSATATTKPTSSKPFVVDCPDLAASHPALSKDSSGTTATGPSFDRSAPPGQLTQVVVVMPSENDAEDALAAFGEPTADGCIKSLLGRQKGAAPATAKRLDVTKWDVPALGEGSAAFDLAATIADRNGEQSFHVGVALVRVGRAIDFVAIFATDPLGESDTGALSTTVSKVATALR